MDMPLVSICIPTYNRPEFLRRAVMSVLAQTYSNLEIIVTDNSRNSESEEVLAKIGDPRIQYYKNADNWGPCPSSNRAVSLAKGKYIKLLMDDDLLRPRCLELTVNAFENHPNVGIVMAPMDLIDETDKRIFPKFYFVRTMQYRYRYQHGDGVIDRKRLLKDFLTRDYPCSVPSGITFRAEALRKFGPFSEEADFAGDLDMCMLIAGSYEFYYIDEILSSWRLMPTCHTARLHKAGLKAQVFYYVTNRCLEEQVVKKLFADEWPALMRRSMLFCDFRALMLNGMAAVRARSPRILWETLQVMWREDKHRMNFLRLPFVAAKEILASIFPPKLPPARE
jgi:glycosyltransferase involved in cell wall biosynthesis